MAAVDGPSALASDSYKRLTGAVESGVMVGRGQMHDSLLHECKPGITAQHIPFRHVELHHLRSSLFFHRPVQALKGRICVAQIRIDMRELRRQGAMPADIRRLVDLPERLP